jgi:geranylgeranyl pyrophosphate synthase
MDSQLLTAKRLLLLKMIATKMNIETHVCHTKASVKLPSDSLDESQENISQVQRLMNNTLFTSTHPNVKQNLSLSAIRHHFLSTGHQVRARLCLDACIKLGVNQEDMFILAAATELLHNASLIHDDIQDLDELRRGQSTVWKAYGQNIAICSGDLLLSAAYGVLQNYQNTKTLPYIIAILHEKTRLAIEGQSDDVTYKNQAENAQKLTIEQYVQIAVKKSGALLSLPLELALIAAEKNEFIDKAREASEAFAVGYQIADDLEDIIKDSGNASKSRSINITFALNDMGYKNEKEQSIAMCHKYLNDAIYHSQKLPAESGQLLVNLAKTLKNKVKY